LKTAGYVFRYAADRLGWHGVSPTTKLRKGEGARLSATAKRRIYRDDELAQTLAAAQEPYRTLFTLAAITGARLSELLGLTWDDVDLDNVKDAEVRIYEQVDRDGQRKRLKTEESRREVPLDEALARVMVAHKLRSRDTRSTAFVFATRTGRPLGQRNVLRALRLAQTRAVDDKGRPTFPILHELDAAGEPVPVPRGAVPNFHGFRHTAASLAIAGGDSAEEVSWQLGHKNSVVTRAVYTQEIKTAERKARRRAKMAACMEALVEAQYRSSAQQTVPVEDGKVRELRD
jgi:integrase